MAARRARKLTVILLLLAAMASGCNGPVAGLYPILADQKSVDVYVVNNHYHTALIVPVNCLTPPLRAKLDRFRSRQFLEIGWGDTDFYRAWRFDVGLAIRAIFFSRGSVMYVAAWDRPPEEVFAGTDDDLYRVRIGEEGAQRLCGYLDKSFALSDSGRAIELQSEATDSSAFFVAKGRYGFLHDCNHWVADGLRETGFPITPCYAMLGDNVGWQIRVFGRRYQNQLLILKHGIAVRP